MKLFLFNISSFLLLTSAFNLNRRIFVKSTVSTPFYLDCTKNNSFVNQDKIVYLDLDNVVTNTKAGKLILSELEKSKKAALLKFEKKEKDLKKIEDEIKKQKNIISEEELKSILLLKSPTL